MSVVLHGGQVVGGRFTLRHSIGAGSFSEVWLADDGLTGEPVALKLLWPEWTRKPKVMARFETEIRVLRVLNHPTIARAIDASIKPPHPYLAMEFVPGNTLRRRLAAAAAQGEFFSAEEVAGCILQIAAGLDHAHHLGIVHRDLKPSNVMLAEATIQGGPAVKILDFGVAKLLDVPHDSQTTVGRVLGTPLFLAPEQAFGSTVGPAADVFTLATLAYSMLTNRYAWGRDLHGEPRLIGTDAGPSEDRLEVAQRAVNDPRPNASLYRSSLSPETDFVLRKGMAVSASDRYPSAGAFAIALAGALLRPVTPRGPSLTGEYDDTAEPPGAPATRPVIVPATSIMPSPLDPPRLESSTEVLPLTEVSTTPYPDGQETQAPSSPAPSVVAAPRSRTPFWLAAIVLAMVLGIFVGARVPRQEDSPPEVRLRLPSDVAPTPTAVSSPSTEAEAPSPSPLGGTVEPTTARGSAVAPPVRRAGARNPTIGPAPSPVESALEAARADPSNVRKLEALCDAIEGVASSLPEADGNSARRCLAGARLNLELSEIESCARLAR